MRRRVRKAPTWVVCAASYVLFLAVPAAATVPSRLPMPEPQISSEVIWPEPVLSPERAVAETVRIDNRGGGNFDTGTGVGVAPNVVLTNAHLTRNPFTFLTRCDDLRVEVDRIATDDTGVDLAVATTAASSLVPVELAEADPKPGDHVLLVGYPAGQLALIDGTIEGTLTRGSSTVLRFSPEPQPGQSGSPLLDDHGRLVGLAYAEDTAGGQGLAFPVSTIKVALERFGSDGILAPAPGEPAEVYARTPACP